ncbi:MAG: pyridoxamine 5'-phosphate oxidase family protein [Acidimicrobiia bacterium]|nr:pyridoxamine 5'-phosphate oxidase family protein [Acidimicrobiia bacterium]
MSEGAHDRGGLRILGPDECRELLERTPVGRVAFVDRDRPAVLPVTYRYHDGAIVFRTAPGAKLHAALAGSPVAFEIDAWDEPSRTGWSVLVRGDAHHVTDPGEVAALGRLGLWPWAVEHPRQYWIRIRPTEVSGRLLGWRERP